ncbi:MAG: bifunctional phosphopantothenoylcysteine decarboxylase/phosphopantothenate--cysteine ligase CoaBC [Limnobacter sp.]|nr:bifunctional phosphopantothenoylcysteine decarboxylase/phosphopantothenate--cysteine ligase CoaBC [Limnobacter sp.]
MNFLPDSGLPVMKDKRIVLCVTGGIAAYKAAELARQLIKQGAQLQVVMTEAACEFIQPLTFQALTGRSVHVSQWSQTGADRGMPHIDLGRWADMFLVAPCTANTMAHIAQGQANNLLENLLLARNCPAALAPAMNVEMWNNPATQRNVDRLKRDGYALFGPASGEQACGETGAGRLLEPEELVLQTARLLTAQHWAGKEIAITAGPTLEDIDPVRAITNHSSGKMGYSLALAAWLEGAQVHLVSGPTALQPVYGVQTTRVKTAREMFQAVDGLLQQKTIETFFGVAAVADFAVKNPSEHKQKKGESTRIGLDLDFELNPDILAHVGQHKETRHNPRQVVGFAAETQNLAEYAAKKLVSKKADFIVGNLAQQAMGADHTTISIFQKNHSEAVATHSGQKLEVAHHLLQTLRQQP